MRGVTLRHRIDGGLIVFQPALPMRGVTWCPSACKIPELFQPALPMRGVTLRHDTLSLLVLFQPALPMRGVTRQIAFTSVAGLISTRTPHAGSDEPQ